MGDVVQFPAPKWRQQWDRYAETRRKLFAAAGISWPEPPFLNEIVCGAIMEQGKK